MLPRFFRRNVARYAQNNAHFTELHQQRRAAVAEKRQRDAGAGDEIRDDRDVQKHLDRQQRRDADADEKAVAVGRVRGDPIAAADEQREQDQNRDRADIAELLADDGKDVVVVLLRQVEIFLPALSETEPEKAARTDGIQRLHDLIAGRARIGKRVAPGHDALVHIGHEFACDEQQRARASEHLHFAAVFLYPCQDHHSMHIPSLLKSEYLSFYLPLQVLLSHAAYILLHSAL